MAAASIEWVKTSIPGMEIARLEATDAETYTSVKFQAVEAATVSLNQDTDADVNVVNSDGTEIDGTTATVKLNLAGITDKSVTLTLYGGASVQG